MTEIIDVFSNASDATLGHQDIIVSNHGASSNLSNSSGDHDWSEKLLTNNTETTHNSSVQTTSGGSSNTTGVLIIMLLLANLCLMRLVRRYCTVANCKWLWNRISRDLSGNNPYGDSSGLFDDPSAEYSAVQLSDRNSDVI